MKIFICFAILFFLYPIFCKAQKPRELTNLMDQVKDASYFDSTLMFNKSQEVINKYPDSETVAEVYLYYGSYYFYIKNFKKAFDYFKLSQKEAEKANCLHIADLAKIRIAYMEYEKGQHIIAEKKLSILLEKQKLNKNNKNIAEIYNFQGIISESKNDLKKAAEIYYQGLLFSEENGLSYYPGVFRNNLGLIKIFSGRVDEALTDLQEGLVIAEKEKNRRLANHLKFNICVGYMMNKEYEKTKQYFADVIQYAKINNFPTELSRIYINLGSILTEDNKFDMALSYYDSAIVIIKNDKLYDDLPMAYFGKVRIYNKMGRANEEKKYLDLSYDILKKSNNQENRSRYYLLLYEFQSKQHDYKNALENYENYIVLKDSLRENLNNKIIEDLQYNYKVQQKETELEKERAKLVLLEISNEREKNNKWLAIASAIVIIIVIMIYFYNRYLRKLKEKQEQFSRLLIQNIEEERKRISMDLHDDIGQTLSVIKSKIINNIKTDSTVDIQNDITQVIQQTREISRNLYPSSLEKIGLIRAVAMLMEDLQSIKGLECSYEIDEAILKADKNIQTNLYRIIQECVNNTIKHSGATGLKVTIEKKNEEYLFSYMDNGTGLKTKKNSQGIGLLSLQERAKILNGYLEIDDKTEKGFKLYLKFKIV